MSKTVTYKMDLNNPPVLSEEQKARLEALDKRPDSEIDFSDIPELDDSFWKNAVQNPYEPRSKHAKTTLVKRGRFVHKTLQNDKVHLKTDNPSAVYDHKYATNSKHCKTIRSNSKPMTSIF